MSDADILSLLVIVLCLLASMFFSSSETAITAMGDRRARQLKEEGGPEAHAAALWVDRPVYVLTTILLGNNAVNTLLGTVVTAFTIRNLGSGPWAEYAVPLAFVGSTFVLLIFGEIVPKALGRVFSRSFAIPALRVLDVLGKITWPVNVVLVRSTELLVARATRGNDEAGSARVTTGELDYLVKVGQEEGSIPAEQAAMLQSIIRFEDKDVRDIMVPAEKVTFVDLRWDAARILEVARSSGHSRLPVYVGTTENIRGVLHIKQLIQLDHVGFDASELASMLRPPMFVSESLLIGDLLKRFQEERVHLAIVVDDAGKTVGVVTLEDVLEQIVGQIFDESDRMPASHVQERHGVWYFSGQDTLATVDTKLGVDLEVDGGVDSVGDLLSRLAGQMPAAGSVFLYDGLRFKVLAADAKRIIRVSIERVEDNDDDD